MIRPKSKERAFRTATLVAGDFLIGWGALAAVIAVDRTIAILFALSLVIALGLSGFYQERATPRTRPSFITAIVIQLALTAIGAEMLVRPLPRTALLAVPILELLALPLWRRLLGALAPIRPRDTILIGHARDLGDALAHLRLDGDSRIRVTEKVTLDQLADAATQTRVRESEELILVSPDADPRVRLELLRIRGPRGFLMLASHVDALLASRTRGWIGDQPLVEVAASCGYGVSAIVKRAMDVAGGAILIVVSAPMWIVTAIAIAIDDARPILIRQQRSGLGGEPYGMWKFRSMRDDNVTRVGSLLRRYHIDELPQLINVLAGDMSLVGPRPERPEIVAKILRDVPDFDLRSLVRPGIAGLAQVSAEYDVRPEVKLRYDLMYICDWSVWLDVRLLFRAVSSSLSGTGR